MKKHTKYLLLVLLILGSNQLHAQPQGQAAIDSLLEELPRQKEDSNKVKLLDDLANAYSSKDPNEAIKHALSELELATKLGWKRGIAKATNTLGQNYNTISDYPRSIQYFERSLKLYGELGHKMGVASVTCNIGLVYDEQGNYPKALEYLLKALLLDEEGGYVQYAANVAANIGIIYAGQQNYEKALEYTFKALKVFNELGFKQGIAAVTCNIGGYYESLNEHEKALEYYFEALKLDEEGGFKQFSAIATGRIAGNYKIQKNYTMAIEYFQRSLEIFEEIGDRYNAAGTLVQIGDMFNEMLKGDKSGVSKMGGKDETGMAAYKPNGAIPMSRTALIKAALANVERGLQISKEINALHLMQGCYETLAETYRLNGEYQKALDASDNSYAIKDSLFSQENKEEILKMGMKNDYDRQRLTDSLKTAEKQKIASINLQKQKSYTYLGVAGILLLAGFSLFIVKERGKSETARKQSDELLLNILPEEVAEELKTTGTTTAKHYDNVTVLFTDFVNFTQAGESMSPQNLIDELHSCFKAFDEIADKYGIEKIKTIGDAYLAVAGLPSPDPKHAENIVNAAKEITAFMEDRLGKMGTERTFAVRIGVHSGSVVAGIVGVKKFAYDIWGDTVNTAARMEQNSEAGKINISQTTYELVKDEFSCEYRGEVEANGKGVMKMYYVC